MMAKIERNSRDCETFRRASLILPLAKAIDAITELPIPDISPIPVKTINSGAVMLMAAMPSLPTLCPTNIPSIAVMALMLIIPSKVGIKIFLNNVEIFSVPKFIKSP